MRFSLETGGETSTVQFITAHSPGSQATCHVNPRKPTQAVLFKGTSTVLLILSVITAFIAGIMLIIVAIKVKKLSGT